VTAVLKCCCRIATTAEIQSIFVDRYWRDRLSPVLCKPERHRVP
jgi:hypothetical protein